MNDDFHPSDTPSEDLLAVNAVLDGIATEDQRALVHASAQLTQLLDEFQTNRQGVAQVEASHDRASAETRELHIAAALAAFDELHRADTVATVAARPAAKVVSLDRHRRMYRTLMGAAAAFVLVVGGVAALGSLGGSDDDSAATATESRKADGDQAATLDAPAPELADTGSASADAPATQSAEAATAMTENTSAPDLTADALEDAAADTNAPAEAAEAPRPTIGSIGAGGADTAQRIANEDELASYVAAPPAVDNSATSAPCVPAGSDNLGNITYQGTLAVVVRDPDTGQVDVFDVDDCTVLVTLPT